MERRKFMKKAVLGTAGLAGTERPEALTVEQWISLANAVAAAERGKD